MRHWWEPIGLLDFGAGLLSPERAQAARRLFLRANLGNGVTEMHNEVRVEHLADVAVPPAPGNTE